MLGLHLNSFPVFSLFVGFQRYELIHSNHCSCQSFLDTVGADHEGRDPMSSLTSKIHELISHLTMSPPVVSVDKLTITFLVDNCIEWCVLVYDQRPCLIASIYRMTKLPPGFTHEAPQHVQLYPEPDEITGVPVIEFDDFCCGMCPETSPRPTNV